MIDGAVLREGFSRPNLAKALYPPLCLESSRRQYPHGTFSYGGKPIFQDQCSWKYPCCFAIH
jgi:hypothetical protein